MKIKKLLFSLSLAGLCFSQASAQLPHPESARHIGDGVKRIDDSNRYEAEPISHAQAVDMSMIAPTSFDMSCDTSCSDGCGSSCSDGCGIVSSGCAVGGSKWFSAETLLWFGQRQNAPALVTTSATGVDPLAGANGVTTQFGGGDGIDFGLLPGFRVGGGAYLDDCQKFGVGGRAWGTFSGSQDYRNSSDGTVSIGIPFFNANPAVAAEDAYLVAFTTGGGAPVSSGDVYVRSDFDMIGADGSIHILASRSDDHRVDMLVGYTYSRLKSSVGLESNSTNLFTGDLIPDGTIFRTNDLFETENIFNGAHLGVLSTVVQNRVSLSTLAKVSFGNMRQNSDIRGFTNTEFNGVVTGAAGGILTQPSNIGSSSRDVFAFIPELGVKLGYCVNPNVQLTVGYSFMMWSSVGLAGDQIDRTVDLAQTVARPASTFAESSFWLQGVDVGMAFTY